MWFVLFFIESRQENHQWLVGGLALRLWTCRTTGQGHHWPPAVDRWWRSSTCHMQEGQQVLIAIPVKTWSPLLWFPKEAFLFLCACVCRISKVYELSIAEENLTHEDPRLKSLLEGVDLWKGQEPARAISITIYPNSGNCTLLLQHFSSSFSFFVALLFCYCWQMRWGRYQEKKAGARSREPPPPSWSCNASPSNTRSREDW